MKLTKIVTAAKNLLSAGDKALSGLFRNAGDGKCDLDPALLDDWRYINRSDYNLASENPQFRRTLREVSIREDEENSYYTGILNLITDQTIGTCPQMIGTHPDDTVNDRVEDAWLNWTTMNGIGSVFRQIRRGAARTGIGIAIPYSKPSDPTGVGLGFKTVCSTMLTTPPNVGLEERIIDGIQYDDNWDPIKIFLDSDDPFEPLSYNVEDIILWFKARRESTTMGLPECAPAFCLFPSVRRYMDAVVRAEEFRACMPMAVELDPNVYRPEDAEIDGVPAGKMKYEPGMIPTLPPGTKLNGIPAGLSSDEKTKFIRMVIGAAARCVSMPANIALGDSSDHNMASAQVDVQPWTNWTNIDRIDYAPVPYKIYKMWHERATLISGYLPVQARNNYPFNFYYDSVFGHPDPQKRAMARQTDLESGSTTLHKVFTEQGLNPRRERQQEARTLGLSMDEYNQLIISKRAGTVSPDASSEATDKPEESNDEE